MTRTITVEEDGDDIILPIPDDILLELGWNEGDILEWTLENDAAVLRRVEINESNQRTTDFCSGQRI